MRILLIAIILFQISENGVCQMSEIIQITYGVQLNIEGQVLEYEVEEIDLNRDFETEEERFQAEKDKIEAEKFAEDWSGFWEERLAKENLQKFIYTVNESSIKYERNQNKRPEEFIRIIPESGTMQHFYKDEINNKANLIEFSLHHNPDSSDWKIDYNIEEFKSERKTILVYDCYRMNIEQTRINEKENWEIVDKYELFVTDKIKLPARLVIHLWEPVAELCALEIKTVNMENPNSFSIERAIEIKNEVDENELVLPKEYADLLMEKNKN
ncbi:MAG: hypothetical protein AAFZ15_03305 [Bacteroidota bacterium]